MTDSSLNVSLPGMQPSALDVEATRARLFPHEIASTQVAWLARHRGDVFATSTIFMLTAIVAWQRLWFWNSLGYLDVATFYMPWYAFLGQHLRAFEIPAWNPHQFSGTPFAGDPQSGWMYLPAMVLFTFFKPVAAYKLFLTFHLALAGISTFIFGRVLRLGVMGSLAAAAAFEFGPLVNHLSCCLIHVQLAVWIPPALLGVELASRATSWTGRSAAWVLTGFAVSQMLAGWIGQGAYNGLLVVGSYALYRTLISPHSRLTLRQRLSHAAAYGAGIGGIGFGLAAAGLLPRLAAISETNVAGGQYSGTGVDNYSGGWKFPLLLDRLMSDGNGYSSLLFYLGGGTLALAMIGVILARKRFAAPYFVGLTVVVSILPMRETWVHKLFFLLPRYEVLQDHVPSRVLAVQWLGPAILAGIAVDLLHRGELPQRLWRIAATPLTIWLLVGLELYRHHRHIGVVTYLAVATVAVVVAGFAYLPRIGLHWPDWPVERTRTLLAVALLALIIWEPAGRVMAGALFDGQVDPVVALPTGPVSADAIAANASATDPGGAGAYLQLVTDNGQTSRYFGYDDALQHGGARWPSTYREWYWLPEAQAILVNARAMSLDLADVQGYNPVQLRRYVNYLNYLNSAWQNYHDAQILPSGLNSPMLNLLNAKYIVIPNDTAPGRPRPDLLALSATHREVFRSDKARVLINDDAMPRAWVVHDIRRADPNSQLAILQQGVVDPRTTAYIASHDAVPHSGFGSGDDEVTVQNIGTDQLQLQVSMASDGLVVVSETYATGWHAYVDGKRTPLYLTDGILRGVPVEAGNHTLEMKYEPRALAWGLWISLGSVIAAAGVLGFGVFAWYRGLAFARVSPVRTGPVRVRFGN